MRTKHAEVMKLFRDQAILIMTATEEGDPVVKLYTDNHEDADQLFNWLAAITGGDSGHAEEINLLYNDWS